MKIIILMLVIFLINNSSMATLAPLNHLIPTPNFGRFYDKTESITNADVSLDKENEYIILQFIQYSPVTSTVLIRNDATNKYRLAYTSQKNFDKKLSKRNTKTISTDVPSSIVSTILLDYERMLIDTHYSKENNGEIAYIDGTVYQFFVSSYYGDLHGQTYSPKKNTNTYYLVESSKALNQFVTGNITKINLELLLTNNSQNISVKDVAIYTSIKSDFSTHFYDQFNREPSKPKLNCNTEEFVPLVASISLVVQELAMDKGLPESEVGAIMMLWRPEACELLDENTKLYTETVDAIEKECSKIIRLKGNNEKEYIEEARKHLSWHKNPSHVVLSWAKEHEDTKLPKHTVIATDGIEGIRVEYPDYGHKGDFKVNCIKKPERIFYF